MNGRFVARAAAGLPFLLGEGDEVRFVPPRTDMPRAARVAEVFLLDGGEAEICFAEISSRDVAGGLVGSHCLIRRDSIDPEAFEQASVMWDGWAVVDARAGDIGRIVGLVENPGQTLLEVESSSGKQVLVPAVDEIVTCVDVEAKTVQVDLPNGLLDL